MAKTGAGEFVEVGACRAVHDVVEVEVVDLVVRQAGRGPDFSTHGSQEPQTCRIGDGEVDSDRVGYIVVVPIDHHFLFEVVDVDPVDFAGIHQVEELSSRNHFHVIDVDLISLAVDSRLQDERVCSRVSVSSIPIKLGKISVV